MAARLRKHFSYGGAIGDRALSVWVDRPGEQELVREILSFPGGSVAFSLQAHRQMGKSTFLNRLADEAECWQVARADLSSERFAKNKTDLEFVDDLTDQLARTMFDAATYSLWKDESRASDRDLGASARLNAFLKAAVAPGRDTLLLIDEFEAIHQRSNFLNILLLGTQATQPSRTGQRVAWVIAGIHPVTELTGDRGPGRSKFSNFLKRSLEDFPATDAVVSQLAEGLAFTRPVPSRVCRDVLAWTGGQPVMTCVILGRYDEARRHRRNPVLKEFLRSKDIIDNEHFRNPEEALRLTPDVAVNALSVYEQLLSGRRASDIRALHVDPAREQTRLCLMRSGLVREDQGKGGLAVRSPMYAHVFDQTWAAGMRRRMESAANESSTIQPDRSPDGTRDSRARIGVINAGGTMGMRLVGSAVQSPRGRDFWYLGPAREFLAATIVDLNPGFSPMDGVKVSPEEWVQLARCIVEAQERIGQDKLTGIVVVTGTDTLAYVASALAFSLGYNLSIPVVVTGSQAPYGVEHGDALINLQRAIAAITSLGMHLKEVVVAFGDEVYRGVRVEKVNDFRYAGFVTPNDQSLAIITEKPRLAASAAMRVGTGGVERMIDILYKNNVNPGLLDSYKNLLKTPLRGFDTRVLRISLYPGLQRDMVGRMLRACRPSGLVLECLGLGNIPNDGDYNLLSIVTECKDELFIPVLITGRFPVDPEFVGQYETASGPLREGAIASGNMTPAASLTKFMWGLAAAKDELGDQPDFADLIAWMRGIFAIPWVGEHDPSRGS